jgi:lycopene beta-cyclase
MKNLFQPHQYSKSNLVFIALWVLTMISLPIVGWTLGESALIRGMSFGVLMQGIAVLMILIHAWGLPKTLKTFAIVGVLSFFAEFIGSKTGIPFGKYYYTDVLQPQLAGVPLLIPLAWMMMLPPAWAMASALIPRTNSKLPPFLFTIHFSLISALAFTAWDLFLDPQMVRWNFWVWEIPGQYFGIPIINYLGWILVSALLTLAANPNPTHSTGSGQALPVRPLMLVYVLTWFLQTIGQGIFWSQPGPALFGFIGMGIFIFLAWKRST